MTHLVGLQAQEPRDPYLALWSRLRRFEPADLEQLLLDHEARPHRPHARHDPPGHGGRRLRAASARPPGPREGAGPPLAVRAAAPRRRPRPRPRPRPRLPGRTPLDQGAPPGARSALPRPRPGRPGLRLPQPPGPRAGAAARPVDPERAGHLRHRGGLAPRAAAARAHPRRGGAPLPAGVRPGHGGRHRRMVAAHRAARGRGAAATRSCAPTATPPAASCSTSPTAPSPTRTSRSRSGSCPSTTTCCSSHADRSRVFDRALLTGLYADGEVGNGSVLVDGVVQATWRNDPRRSPQVVVTHQPKLSRRDRAAVEAEAHRAIAYLAPGRADARDRAAPGRKRRRPRVASRSKPVDFSGPSQRAAAALRRPEATAACVALGSPPAPRPEGRFASGGAPPRGPSRRSHDHPWSVSVVPSKTIARPVGPSVRFPRACRPWPFARYLSAGRTLQPRQRVVNPFVQIPRVFPRISLKSPTGPLLSTGISTGVGSGGPLRRRR